MIDRTVSRAYPVRDVALLEWEAEQDREGYKMSPMERACARAAFIAGWEARKRAQYSGEVS
jgi:hypothetical protein